jgi:hypothetical protein
MRPPPIDRPPSSPVLAARVLAFLAAAVLTACAAIDKAPPGQPDARTALRLSAAEREHMKAGMRVYLEAVQGIVDAQADGKPARIADSARKAGMSAVADLPVMMAAKLPAEFTMLSLDTHRKFDALAQESGATGAAGQKAVTAQLRDILANCTACHASYRTAPE